APIRGMFRKPSEVGTSADGMERVGGIVARVARKSELAASRQHAGKFLSRLWRDQSPPQMPLLRPRIGKQNEEASDCSVRQPGNLLPRAAVRPREALDPSRSDRADQASHAVDERLAADEADIFVVLSLKQEMLPRAEADFEPNLFDGNRKEIF